MQKPYDIAMLSIHEKRGMETARRAIGAEGVARELDTSKWYARKAVRKLNAEAPALTPADFDFEKSCVLIIKTNHHNACKDVMAPPETCESTKAIVVFGFPIDEVQHFLISRPSIASDDCPLLVTKCYLERGYKARGVKGSAFARPAP